MQYLKNKSLCILTIILIIAVYFYKIGSIPEGTFCDEAMYSLQSTLSKKYITFEDTNYLFHNHFGYTLGNLNVAAPYFFTKIFGVNSLSIRLTSAFFGILSLMVIGVTLKELRVKYFSIPVLILATTPVYFHFSRIYFGMTPSIFFMSLAYLFYIKAYIVNRWKLSVLAGFYFALSTYGYLAFMISTPLLVFSITIIEILYNKTRFSNYKKLIITIISFLLFFTPILIKLTTDKGFTKRFEEKTNGGSIYLDYKNGLIKYIRYFNFKYLFIYGENSQPGSFITRHSITNSGLFPISFLILLILLPISIVVARKQIPKYIWPFLLLMLMYPIPDMISSKVDASPYTFPLSGTIIFIPFVASISWIYIQKNATRVKFLSTLFVIFIISGFAFFYFGKYLKNDLYTSDYWGWQYGPKEIVNYFINNQEKYDYMCMEGVFNEPQVFISFYDYNNQCKGKCGICSISDPHIPYGKKLFAVSTESFSKYSRGKGAGKDYFIKQIIYYPNLSPAFYIITQPDYYSF